MGDVRLLPLHVFSLPEKVFPTPLLLRAVRSANCSLQLRLSRPSAPPAPRALVPLNEDLSLLPLPRAPLDVVSVYLPKPSCDE